MNNLVFLISQPRSGSTLLQKMLSAHHDVHTVGEPWLILPLFLHFDESQYIDVVNAKVRKDAVRVFISELTDGENTYNTAVRQFVENLYKDVLRDTQSRYFLDKTPRNYEIIYELSQTFLNAKFVFLIRNPMAVLCSILNTWITDDPFYLHHYRRDLLEAPHCILESNVGDRAITVHYEELVSCPNHVLESICKFLEIEFDQTMINYGEHVHRKWHLGDKDNVYNYTRPCATKADQWQAIIEKPYVWRLVNDYYWMLGEHTIARLGYSARHLRKILDSSRPKFPNITPSLCSCLTYPQLGFPVGFRINRVIYRNLWRRFR